ncbi:AEC family transporter [Acinetobacter sp. ANC 4945]|uniref:Transporter n=1 Tax=Acinetobacter amyesii TaxID=2942470 RepID=A0A1T1GSE4_9GAMM|nr:AEC family transporter [Acinetobacter amyesii]MCL6246321.1 AEC family transporter [Acinetobacter amyesii]OOV80549.1 transporter [Acinetobacter amyesii]
MVFEVIGPIFFLLALGYLSVKCSLLSKEQVGTIGAFVIKIALPALFFQSLASKDLHQIWYPGYFFVYTGVTFLLYGMAYWLLSTHFKNNMSQTAVLSLGAGMSNTGLIGTAVLSLLVGQNAMTYTSLIVIIESVLLIPTVLVLAQLGSSQQKANIGDIIKNTLLTLLKNPLFAGVMLGIGFAIFQIRLPHQINDVLAMLGQTASPLALFAIGGGIVGMSLKYVNAQSFYLVISSNLVMPLLTYFGLRYLTDVSQEMLYAGTIIAALPMPTIFAMLGQVYGLNEKTLTPLLMSTILGFVVTGVLISLWWA